MPDRRSEWRNKFTDETEQATETSRQTHCALSRADEHKHLQGSDKQIHVVGCPNHRIAHDLHGIGDTERHPSEHSLDVRTVQRISQAIELLAHLVEQPVGIHGISGKYPLVSKPLQCCHWRVQSTWQSGRCFLLEENHRLEQCGGSDLFVRRHLVEKKLRLFQLLRTESRLRSHLTLGIKDNLGNHVLDTRHRNVQLTVQLDQANIVLRHGRVQSPHDNRSAFIIQVHGANGRCSRCVGALQLLHRIARQFTGGGEASKAGTRSLQTDTIFLRSIGHKLHCIGEIMLTLDSISWNGSGDFQHMLESDQCCPFLVEGRQQFARRQRRQHCADNRGSLERGISNILETAKFSSRTLGAGEDAAIWTARTIWSATATATATATSSIRARNARQVGSTDTSQCTTRRTGGGSDGIQVSHQFRNIGGDLDVV